MLLTAPNNLFAKGTRASVTSVQISIARMRFTITFIFEEEILEEVVSYGFFRCDIQ